METSKDDRSATGGIKTSLGIKLLVPLTLILAVSFLGLFLIIISSQSSSLNEMGIQVNELLTSSNKTIGLDLQKMNSDVNKSLQTMSKTTSDQLTQSTTTALSKEKNRLTQAWITSLEENTHSLANVLAQVAPTAILNNDLTALISYVQSAGANENVIYAMYFRPNGKPYVRYLDRNKEKIKTYIKTGEGKKKYEKVIFASKNDPDVFIVNKKIELDGKELGYLSLCINEKSVEQKIAQMSSSFDVLIEGNSEKIESILSAESLKVKDQMGQILDNVSQKNETVIQKSNQVSCSSVAM